MVCLFNNRLAWERKFPGANSPGSESSRALSLLGAKVHGNEKSRGRAPGTEFYTCVHKLSLSLSLSFMPLLSVVYLLPVHSESMAEDAIGKAGLFFDELNKIRVLEPEVAVQTNDLKDECKDFLESELNLSLMLCPRNSGTVFT